MATSNEQRRATFAEVMLRTGNKRIASLVSGWRDKRALSKLLQRLEETHTLTDRPRSGRPKKYTDEVLQVAQELLAEDSNELWTTASLLQSLAELHLVQLPADAATFREALKHYVTKQHHQLVTHSTGTIFLITTARAKQRVQWCKNMLDLIKHTPLHKWWIEDETQLAERPHHKGRVAAIRLLPTALSAWPTLQPKFKLRSEKCCCWCHSCCEPISSLFDKLQQRRKLPSAQPTSDCKQLCLQ